MNSKLLEEAIIDAEALREAALKNAEQAVLEKYAPEIKNAISRLLEQDEQLADAPMPINTMDALKNQPQMDVPLAATEGEELCPCPEAGRVLTFTASDLEDAIKKTISDAVRSNANPTAEEPAQQQPLGQPSMMTPEEEQDVMTPEPGAPILEEIDISEELIASILSESETSEEEVLQEETLEESDLVEQITEEENVEEQVTEESSLQEETLEEEVMEEDDTSEMIQENKSLSSQNSKLLVERKRNLNENKLLTEKLANLTEQHNKLLKENREFKTTLTNISKRLEESNLLNAKLFYKNQALGNHSLNERQKNKIVEAVSVAGSVEDVKMIYETLCNAVGTYENKGPQSLDEAIEKKGGLFLQARQKDTVATSQNPLYSKWQKIAGIKKEKQS
jgi:hypothetical protein